MTTSSQNLFSSGGIDRIEEYLHNRNIPFRRIDDRNIDVPSYRDQTNTVRMLILYDADLAQFSIQVGNGNVVGSSAIDEVNRYFNHVNHLWAVGAFFVHPYDNTIVYKFGCFKTVSQITDEFLEQALRVSFLSFDLYALPSQVIINGGSLQDALAVFRSRL